ncbi:MAG TPA: pilus assembly protein N-terminal domain-containing protein, partial [Candidatus Margulisiibacteriota bacterium]|nr:pilus assembly protein N-terminal domain-containing protein [Candidatus Margulisiibacteriota bacterium]
MKKPTTFALCLCLVLTCGLARAEEPTADETVIPIGTIKTITVNSPKRIAVGNPDIADVTSAKEGELTILGKAQGTTSLVVWDSFGEQKYSLIVTPTDMVEAKGRIDSILETLGFPSVNTKIEDKEGKIFLLGSVKTPQDKEKLAVALTSLKDKIVDLIEVKEEEAVVEIDVQVLELNKDATRTLGLTWPGALNLIEKGSPGIQSAGTKPSTLFKVLNLERAIGSTADPFTFKLDALVQEGKAQILSRPRLACQSGKEAELLVGGEKPIFTTDVVSGGGSGTSVEYKEYGIKLKVKPTVTEGDRIKLGVNVEVSEVGTAETIGDVTAPTAKAYPLSKRTASTELFLDNGQSMAIGGMIKQKSAEDVRRVPGLSNIPILGLLFRQKTATIGGGSGERGNVELFIILTPTIISQKPDLGLKEAAKEAPPESAYYTVDEDLSTPLGKYASVVKKRILDNLTYPSPAKEAGFQGEVNLRLLLSYKGDLLQAKI